MNSKLSLIVACIVLTCSALIVGCAGAGFQISTPDRITAEELKGTWASMSIQIDERSVNCPAQLSFNDLAIDCGENETFEFRADGTYTFSTVVNGQPGSQTGLWFIREDDTLELKNAAGEHLISYIISRTASLDGVTPMIGFNEIFGASKTTKVLAKSF